MKSFKVLVIFNLLFLIAGININSQNFNDALRLRSIYRKLKVYAGELEAICERHEINGLSQFKEYVKAAKSPETFKAYLNKYVYGCKTQAEYLEAVGGITKLLTLRQSMI